MTSSNGNIFRVTGPLCGEFSGHRWITLTKASNYNAELWCFPWSAPWINSWVNNCGAGDLRRHRVHYDVIVMSYHEPALVPVLQHEHYSDVMMSVMAYQITRLAIVYSTVCSSADQRRHQINIFNNNQSSASLAFVRGIQWSPVNSPHKGPVTRNMFPFNDVIMELDLRWSVKYPGQSPQYLFGNSKEFKYRWLNARLQCDMF